jgi:tubby-related protein 1
MVQCYVKREKDSTGIYPEFKLYLQDGDRFLLTARRRKKSKTSNFLISLESDDLARNGGAYFGKLRGNYVGTEYVLYNNGLKPGKNVQVRNP